VESMKAVALLVIGVAVTACTLNGSSEPAPSVDEATATELQARAFMRACSDVVCAGAPIYAPESASEQLRAELLKHTDEIRYVSATEVESATSSSGRFDDGATMFEAGSPHDTANADVVGVDVWITKGFQDATRRTYLFAWDGTEWIDATSDASGVTVTSSVS
jgi:hypothetical protein